jgi:hypothetical protein
MSLPLLDRVREEARELISDAAAQVAMNAMGWREAMAEFGVSIVADFMALVQQQVATGAEKKAAVLALAAEFYDEVIEPIDLIGPDAVIDPLLRTAWLKGLELTIDGIVAWFKSISVEQVLAIFRKSST